MKKIILILLMILSLSLFSACNVEDLVNQYLPKEAGEDGEGTQDDGGSSEDEVDPTKDHSASEAENKFDQLRLKNGFYIEFNYKSNSTESEAQEETLVYAANHDVYYYKTTSDECIIDLSDDTKFTVYNKYEEGWECETTEYFEGFGKEEASQLAGAYGVFFSSLFSMYEYMQSTGYTKTTATVAGRSCDKYTTKEGSVAAQVSYTFYIDKEMGICLKWEVSGSSLEGSGMATFECTQFATSYNIVLPEVEEPADE